MELSLDYVRILINDMKEQEIQSVDLFYCDYLVPIYFYLNLADEIISYVERYYNL